MDVDEDKVANLQERIKTRIKNKVSQQQKIKKALTSEDLKRPVVSPSLESIISEVPNAASTSHSKVGRPRIDDLDEYKARHHADKLRPMMNSLRDTAKGMNKTLTQLLGRMLEIENYQKNRNLAMIGKQIYEGKAADLTQKKSISLPEAEFIKTHETSVSANQWQNMRLRLLPFVRLPTVHEMRGFDQLP